MRLLRFSLAGGPPRTGLLDGDDVCEAPGVDGATPWEILLRDGAGALDQLSSAARNGLRHRLDDVTLCAPLTQPEKILCVGLNYPEHAAETKSEAPAEPIFFAKLASAITGPRDAIELPAAAPRRVDYEAELAVVVGRTGRDIAEARAMDHVLGYLVANDVSARDWQMKKPGGQWLLGKSFDTFLPVGPWVVTADEIGDPAALRVTCAVDGESVQDDVVGNMIYSISELIAYVSRVATLRPGDLLLTGTPSGIGASRQPPRWLTEGNVVETAVTGIGTLRNTVRSATAAS
jgi:2-keto-4-pentenoate hydratase/2-oxohepta-3-ene-1,7-dioic acid hydratase in catechol pathway